MVATNISSEGMSRSATGGSTGEHTPFYQDLACLNPKIALEYRFNRWAGWDVGEPIAFVWPAIQDFAATPSPKRRLRNVLLDRRLMLYSGHLDEQTMADHSRRLRTFACTDPGVSQPPVDPGQVSQGDKRRTDSAQGDHHCGRTASGQPEDPVRGGFRLSRVQLLRLTRMWEHGRGV